PVWSRSRLCMARLPSTFHPAVREPRTPPRVPPGQAAGRPPARPGAQPDRRWWLAAAGLLLFFLGHPLVWPTALPALWFPSAGVALLLVAWLGPRAAVLVAAVALLVALGAALLGGAERSWAAALLPLWDALLTGPEAALAWWVYRRLAQGARRLSDPRSAMLFVLLVPGATAGLFAALRALPVAFT